LRRLGEKMSSARREKRLTKMKGAGCGGGGKTISKIYPDTVTDANWFDKGNEQSEAHPCCNVGCFTVWRKILKRTELEIPTVKERERDRFKPRRKKEPSPKWENTPQKI